MSSGIVACYGLCNRNTSGFLKSVHGGMQNVSRAAEAVKALCLDEEEDQISQGDSLQL